MATAGFWARRAPLPNLELRLIKQTLLEEDKQSFEFLNNTTNFPDQIAGDFIFRNSSKTHYIGTLYTLVVRKLDGTFIKISIVNLNNSLI